MSPISAPNKCPNVIEKKDKNGNAFFFCSDYERRPEECINHSFPANYCPIGMDVLNIQSADQLRIRIDTGLEMLKEINSFKGGLCLKI